MAMLKELFDEVRRAEPQITQQIDKIASLRNDGVERTFRVVVFKKSITADARFDGFMKNILRVWEVEDDRHSAQQKATGDSLMPYEGEHIEGAPQVDHQWSDVVEKTWERTFLHLWREALKDQITRLYEKTKEHVGRKGGRIDQAGWLNG